MQTYKLEKTTVKLLKALGILLSIIQFFYNRSLWLDESYLSLNIINRNYKELLQPLDYEQVAPILFINIEKIFSILIPNSEYGLRLFPLISYWATLFLFYKIIKIVSANNYTIIIIALSIFVFNHTIIFYSSEVKQYMIDLLITNSIFYLLLREYKNGNRKYLYLAIAGIFGIFLSNISIIILTTAGLYLLHSFFYKKKENLKLLFIVGAIWISTFLLYYILFIHNHPTRDFQVKYWINAEAFLPLNPFDINFYKFLWDKGVFIFYESLFYTGKAGFYLFPILITLGIINLIRIKKADLIILLAFPMCIHLILSGFKLYPFYSRLIIYNIPLLIIIYSFTINSFLEAFTLYTKKSISKLIVILLLIQLGINLYENQFPIEREEIKESIRFLEANTNNTDRLFLHSKTRHAYNYYTQIGFIKNKFDSIVIGKEYEANNFNENEKYVTDMQKLKGPYWILFSHDPKREEEYIIKHLDSLGYRGSKKFECKGSSIYFYDFK